MAQASIVQARRGLNIGKLQHRVRITGAVDRAILMWGRLMVNGYRLEGLQDPWLVPGPE